MLFLGWAVIVTAFILALLSIVHPVGLAVNTEHFAHLSANQWNCRPAVWTLPPDVRNGTLNGDVAVSCHFEGIGNVGIAKLQQYIVDSVPNVVSRIEGNPTNIQFEGLPAVQFHVVMDMNSDRASTQIYGANVVASDGVSKLRNVFISDRVEAEGYGRLVHSVNSEIRVTKDESQQGWYFLTYSQSVEIEKPRLVPAGMFTRNFTRMFEEELNKKAESIVTNFSNHL